MNKLMKLLILTLTVSLLFTACGGGSGGSSGSPMTDEEIVAADNDDLDIAYGSSDDINNVTTHLILVTEGTYGSTITWSSSHPGIIAADGTVTRPPYGTGDATVTLTATIIKGSISETKTFTLIVKQTPPTEAEAVAADKTSLVIGYAEGDHAGSVTQNVTLPTSGSSGTTITWGTSNSGVITIGGVVTRPTFGLGDATVTLTATITKGSASDTKTFALTVKEAPQTDAQAVAADKASLEIGYLGSDSAGSVTQNVTLPTSGSSGTTITWGTSNSGVITIGGVVTRPTFGLGDATVTLTATITKGSASDTKDFIITVKQTPPTDTEAVAADTTSLVIGYSGLDSAGSVTQNVTLPTSGSSGTTITWVTSNSSVVSIDGTVTRPSDGSGDITVILTATITKGIVSDTKDFTLTVKEVPLAGTNMAYTLPSSISFNMRYIPGGTFPQYNGYQTINQTISTPYWMAETEVTYELWIAVYEWAVNGTGGAVGEGEYTIPSLGRKGSVEDGSGMTNQHPVTMVSWRAAMVWCNALTEYYNANNGTDADLDLVYYTDSGYTTPIRTATDSTTITATTDGSQDKPYVKSIAKGFRLPTSMEWECAARYIDGTNWTPSMAVSGGTESYTGIDAQRDYDSFSPFAWYGNSITEPNGNTITTQPVRQKYENSLDLYDMSGNVFEWCFDWHPSYSGQARVQRGGSWASRRDYLQLFMLANSYPYTEYVVMGLRFVRTQ